MIFGVLKDIKEGENRVICTPVEVASIKAAGHTVLVQSGAGVGSGFSDEKYAAAGGEIVSAAEEMWKRCDFLAKVKEIQPDEFGLPREGQMIYCCIHPAGHPEEVVRPPESRGRSSAWSPCSPSTAARASSWAASPGRPA